MADRNIDDDSRVSALRDEMRKTNAENRTEYGKAIAGLRKEVNSRFNNVYIIIFAVLWMVTVMALVALFVRG